MRRKRGTDKNDLTGETMTAAAYKASTQSQLMRETAEQYMAELTTSNPTTPTAPVDLQGTVIPFAYEHRPESATSSSGDPDADSDSESDTVAGAETPRVLTQESTPLVITDPNWSSTVTVHAGPAPSLAVSSLHSNDSWWISCNSR